MCRTIPDRKVLFGPVHMGRWSIWTSMGLKSPPDGCWDPIRGQRQDRGWSEALHRKRRGRSTRGILTQLDLGGLTHFQWDVGSIWPTTSPGGLWRYHERVGRWTGQLAHVASWRSPMRANVLLKEATLALIRANVILERGDVLPFAWLRFRFNNLM